jgi:UDP-N-acetylmuramate--alanine ligase
MEEFVKSFKLSDYLVITDVYAASEKPSEGADIHELYAKITAEYGSAAIYLKKDKIVEHLLEAVRPGDLLLTLGAGDITQLSDQFIAAWRQRHPSDNPQKLNA